MKPLIWRPLRPDWRHQSRNESLWHPGGFEELQRELQQVKQMLEEKVQGQESHDTIFLDQFSMG